MGLVTNRRRKVKKNLEHITDDVVVTMAVAKLHFEVCGGTTAKFVDGVDDLDLCSSGALGVEVALTEDFVKGGDDDIAKVGGGGR